MKKYFIISFLLIIINIILFLYLNNLINNRFTYSFVYEDKPILVHNKNIELNNINEFDFNNYFKILTFNDQNYTYNFDDNNLIIIINDNKYKVNYNLFEPEIIERIVYVDNYIDKPKYKNKSPNNKINDTTAEEVAIKNDYFYIDNNYFEFVLDTDLTTIVDVLTSNLHTTYVTKLDYSNLNVSQIGQYSVYYISENQKIEVLINIV